ncbi:GNAT family N-acetyltransferase [Phaeacidiphilus oryzae]|uniref:GNAT family N-acetyltransferase n=1 Tax=Phaeacidiphilus oryzae TaxID=348818 RepID=UPI00068ED34E|nr:GNAT family N-acetyltransferase [Phaeacidiphilus oryzae]
MTSTFPEISISTDRLLLRHFEEEDVPSLAAMLNDEAVAAWTDLPQPYTEEEARAWVLDGAPAERRSGRGIVLAVTEHLTQRLVGMVRVFATDWRLHSAQGSVVTAPWARGEGYAAEALAGTAQWLFEDQGFERLEFRTAAGDTAAQQVAQKLGCISEGVLRSAWIVRADGAPSRTDLIVWSLLPEDLDDLAAADPADASGLHPRDGLQRGEYAHWE